VCATCDARDPAAGCTLSSGHQSAVAFAPLNNFLPLFNHALELNVDALIASLVALIGRVGLRNTCTASIAVMSEPPRPRDRTAAQVTLAADRPSVRHVTQTISFGVYSASVRKVTKNIRGGSMLDAKGRLIRLGKR
jgi:hypothetical protein